MEVFKKIVNVLGIIVSAVISLILTGVLIITPLVNGVSSFFEKENLSRVVERIDFAELLFGEEGISPEMGKANPLLENMMQTGMFEDLLELYIEDVLGTIEGTGEKHLTTQAVLEVVSDHKGEMVPMMRETLGVGEELLSDEDIEQYVLMMFEENGDSFLETFPTMEELGLSEEMLEGIRILASGILVKAAIVAVVCLSIFILLCRWGRFKGFIWLGVVYAVSAVVVLLEALGISNAGAVITPTVGVAVGTVVKPMLSLMSELLFKSAGLFAGLALVFILIYGVGRKIKSNISQNKGAAVA